ncbi:MAG: 1,3-beta-glucanase [Chloroflexi bacterium HGW-Chloroflexi-6]|nr:MAG: 1,3-beta-glucanase [Chloroflexi bacterium HGW-Chloroflexi-6]
MSKSQLFPRVLFIGVILILVLMMGLPTAQVGAQKAAALGAWTLHWSDEFSGTGALNSANWIYDIGTSYPGGAANWGTGEIESNTNSTNNVYQSGGYLYIKPIRAADNSWTSGRVETVRTDFEAPAGGAMAVEGRLQLPNVTGAAAQGYWPAFWLLGAPFRGNYWNWPSIGEMDIMENINGQNTLYSTLHCGVNPGGPCNETSGIGGNISGVSPSLQSAFHTYRVEWDKSVSPNQLRWYLDGVQFHTVNANQVDTATWNNAFNHGYFIILNVAIGGGWPGGPTAATTSGVPMAVDYVRVYYANGSGATATATSNNPTATPVNPTATSVNPTATSSTVYTNGVNYVNSNSALIWLKPTGSMAWVDVHYNVNGGAQQNFRMVYNSATARWEQTATGLAAGNVINYYFTYYTNAGYDSPWYAYTHTTGATATPTSIPPTATRTAAPATATPTSTGGFTYGVTNLNASQARPWFKPSGWVAGYVILHYKVNNGTQQNVNMSYNTSAAEWRYTISALQKGQVITYFYTYQKAGIQYDTAWYSWTKP